MRKITIYQCRKGVILEEREEAGPVVIVATNCEGVFTDEELTAAVTRIVRNWREPADAPTMPRS